MQDTPVKDILFLSHCVPNPPDKGDRIRAHFELLELTKHYRVHVVCFARSAAEAEAARALRYRCASVHVEQLNPKVALGRAGMAFLAGRCLSTAYYETAGVRQYIAGLATRIALKAVVVYCSSVVRLAPEGLPLVHDLVDVDSEKWLQYGTRRPLGPLYRAEGRRLRQVEIDAGRRAVQNIFTTENETALFHSFCPEAKAIAVTNGVDFTFFDPAVAYPEVGALAGKRYLVFVGMMDYFPNADGAVWFAREVFPEIRKRRPELELAIVGRNPTAAVRALGEIPGVLVTGGVPDVRPYVQHAEAAVVPLRIARGVQNKVLEAMAMGKRVLVSPAVMQTFGGIAPMGVVECSDAQAYVGQVMDFGQGPFSQEIRESAMEHFRWEATMQPLLDAVNEAVEGKA